MLLSSLSDRVTTVLDLNGTDIKDASNISILFPSCTDENRRVNIMSWCTVDHMK